MTSTIWPNTAVAVFAVQISAAARTSKRLCIIGKITLNRYKNQSKSY
jgi:hypothetical protein